MTRVRLTLAVLLGAAALPLTTAAAIPVPRAPRASLPPTCTDAQLRITRGGGDAGLSHYSTAVLFTNISTRTCTLRGYPGADGLIGSRHDVARRTLSGYLGGAKGVSRVLLHRGGVASAVVEGNTGCAGQGKPVYTGLLITAPAGHRTTRLVFTGAACGLQVHPIASGRTGSSRP